MTKQKKSLLIILIVLLIILTVLIFIVFEKIITKSNFENEISSFADKNKKTIFSINKCILFGNCNAKNKTGSNTNFTIENLYQYTDIALFISNNNNENTLENTLKSVKICNLNYSQTPELRNTKNIL